MRFMSKIKSRFAVVASKTWDSDKVVSKEGKEAIDAADEIILHPAKDCLIGRSNGKDLWYAWGHVEGDKFVVKNFEPLLEKMAASVLGK